jgi:hypothetical protein
MGVIDVPRSVRIEAEEILSRCGARGVECVVYLCGVPDGASGGRVAAVYHPVHTGSAVGYEVPVPELSKLNYWLHERGISVLVQAHTHPGAAFHSGTDDRWPTIETIGFLSLVVPSFARGGLSGLPGCYLAEYRGSGNWREVLRSEMLQRIRMEE